MPDIRARVQVNAPFGMLWERYLPLFLAERLNPEVGLDGPSLDRFSRRDFMNAADKLHQAGLQITLHGPFQDILPGALDSKILAASRARLQEAFDLLEIFRPRSIVCHMGYESRHYQGLQEKWLDHSVATWEPLAAQAARHDCLVALENVYETQPELIKKLFDRLQAPNIRICLDVGHLQAFGGGNFQQWLDLLGNLVGQLHLHDNNGDGDEHLAPGQGTIPFSEILGFFAANGYAPLITLEPHQASSLLPALEYLGAVWPW